MRIEFCGAFQGVVTLRKDESPEEAAERVQQTLQSILDREARRFGVAVGVDFGDLRIERSAYQHHGS